MNSIPGCNDGYIDFDILYIKLLLIMHSFKSSPLLTESLVPKFSRNSRRISKRRVSKEQELLIPNPFRQSEQENLLPFDLKLQV